MSKAKKVLFDYFGYIATIFFSILIIITVIFEIVSIEYNWRVMVTILSLIVTSSFLIQRQKLQETELFNELFKDFNNRYDEMNEHLLKIKDKEGLDSNDKSRLVDYFNLCAEEYLFNKKGYIPTDVWKSWENGMKFYMADDHIWQFWLEEKETESYYGLVMPRSE